MPESKKTKNSVAISQQRGQKYSTKKLLKSKHLAGYQPDFARAILTEAEYSIPEALEVLEKTLKGGQQDGRRNLDRPE